MNSKSSSASTSISLEDVGVFTRYGTLVVGGLCLLMYSSEIGQFPEGMGLGEGLAFYAVCAGFLVAYVFYISICTATGCLLLGWPAEQVQRALFRRLKARAKPASTNHVRTDFSTMMEWPVSALGAVGLVFHVGYIYLSPQPTFAALFLFVPIAQGAGVVLLLIATRKRDHLDSGVLVSSDNSTDTGGARRNLSHLRRGLLVWLLVAPMLVLPDRLFLVDAAFRMVQLRKESATVHVKAPWSVKVAQSTLQKGPSFLGSDYVEFQKVKVLLRSVGQKVVIEFPTQAGARKLSIPSDAVYVE